MTAAYVPRSVGRYRVYGEIAAGGMASVHLGRVLGPGGFARTVAVKRLHAHYAKDPEFVSMLLDEARLAARIRHPNVVSTLDVVALSGELFVVMDYVPGLSISALMRCARESGEVIPPRVAVSIVMQALLGLHAAHEATDDRGAPLAIVHRDVSPQNILLGEDGQAKLVDFGIAKAVSRLQTTQEGKVKGKLAYMAPEQLRLETIDRRADIFAMGIVLWEMLTGQRFCQSNDPGRIIANLLTSSPLPPSKYAPGLPPELDAVLMKTLAREPSQRFDTARDTAIELEKALTPAGTLEVSAWVSRIAATFLSDHKRKLADVENSPDPHGGSSNPPAVTSQAPPEIRPQQSSQPPTTLAASPTALGARRMHAWVWRAALLLLCAVGGVVIFAMRTRGSMTEVAAAAAPLSAPSATSVIVPPAIPASPNSAPKQVLAVVDPNPAVAGSATVARASRNNTRAPAVASKKRVATDAPSANCNPPYVITASGAKRFLPECLR